MPTDERVLVIPTDHFRSAGYFHGFRRADPAYRDAILRPDVYQFRPRAEVESDPGFKQLIPYVVLKCRGELFHYRRGSAGSEKRLTALRSVGIGGHICETDTDEDVGPYRAGLIREVREEVEIGGGRITELLLGFINDDRTPVGRVHLGVVHLWELSERDVRPREESVADAGFATLAALVDARDEFETWSQFVLDVLDEMRHGSRADH
jgi:predicted NUDIX family phosphoesterase